MSETIVFFGSGPVAADSLELLARTFTIETVITKPRPAHHRGSVPVLEVAQRLNLPTIEVNSKQELSKKISEAAINSSVAVLIDFGIIVDQDVIDAFPLGIVNSHFSLLPEWRGADPISFAILSGQTETGVSLMLLVQEMDEGPLLDQQTFRIKYNETTPSLTDELIQLSYSMLCETLPAYVTGTIEPVPQEVAAAKLAQPPQVSYSRKLTKDDGTLDWHKPAEVLEREIRAFYGWPKSRMVLANQQVVILKAHVVEMDCQPGQLIVSNKSLAIGTKHNALAIDLLIPAGKKEMPIAAYLAGYGQKLL
ncbi:MAG: methionyl-tRNA formyltransferase [Candidatus Saccharimonadales bacterium]